MTPTEIARLACALTVLRPDWPTPSVQTFLERELAHRPLHDTAVAMTWIATDPDTKTPRRVLEAGPWWATSRTTVDRQQLEPCPTHGVVARRDGECASCYADRRAVAEPLPQTRPGVAPSKPLRQLVADTRGSSDAGGLSCVRAHTGRVSTMPPVESMRRNPFGAVFCDEHRRWEPTHLTKRRERCHQPAIEGTDQCRMHPGQKLDAVKAKGQAAVARQRFRDVDPSEYLDPSDVLLWTVTLARVDLADYRAELREVAAAGDVPAEQLDRLSRLQIDAARMAKMAIDAGIEERRIRAAEALGDRLIQLVRGLLSAMGHDPDDPKVAAIARSHLELMTGSAA